MPFWKKKPQSVDVTSDGLIKIRGGTSRNLFNSTHIDTRSNRPRNYIPRGLNRRMVGAVRLGAGYNDFYYDGHNRGQFYRYLRDNIPILNAGVWAWVRLCATKMTQLIEGESDNDKIRAEKLFIDLDRRILEIPYGRGSGLTKLTEAFFLELFTTGKFAGEAVLTKDNKAIDHFRYIDPYLIGWEHTSKGWTPFVHDLENDKKEKIDPNLFFYSTLGTDMSNPAGAEPLASIPFVVEVEQLMLEDMARSSHNAGTPRMQVKIERPEQYSWEDEIAYNDRANNYFKDVVGQFQSLEPDDNIFTWAGVDVAIVGESGLGHHWRLGREQVIEDVITGLKLFPWVLGRTHKTTQNWVQSQFDLLMEIVAAHQKSGADLVDWLCTLELKLNSVKAHVSHRFADHPDPFRLERARAKKIELENIDFKVSNGYITKDEGAREMGIRV